MNKLADSPAFPHAVSFTPDSDGLGSTAYVVQQGLTKREYFAALAMQGLVSNFQLAEFIVKSGLPTNSTTLAKTAIANADALIAELAKTASQSC